MTDAVRLLLAAGWLAHVLSWLLGFARARGRGAEAGELPREIALRILIVALLAYSVFAPSTVGIVLPSSVKGVFLALFWAGQLAAVWARHNLGSAWGIGITPRVASAALRGIYRYLHHPIYAGTSTALLTQFLLLQNLPSLLLLIGAALVVPAKIARENRALRPQV